MRVCVCTWSDVVEGGQHSKHERGRDCDRVSRFLQHQLIPSDDLDEKRRRKVLRWVWFFFSFLFCGLTLPPQRGLCWKTAMLPVATKSWYHNLSLKKPELKQSRKWEQCQQVKKHRPGSGGTSAGLTGVVRVRLQAVDHVVVGFK